MFVEEWRPVGRDPRYAVSSLGRVRGPSGRILRPNMADGKYAQVRLGAKSTWKSVHILMLEAFVGPRPPQCECRHLDGNPRNNTISNLAWGTRSENALDRTAHGTATGAASARANRERIAVATQEAMRRPEIRARHLSAMASPAYRARLREAQRARRQRERAARMDTEA